MMMKKELRRTQAFEIAKEAVDTAGIIAIVFWMPMLVMTFLGIIISFE
jgi:hypothetical protein